jgi:hypothetical protein
MPAGEVAEVKRISRQPDQRRALDLQQAERPAWMDRAQQVLPLESAQAAALPTPSLKKVAADVPKTTFLVVEDQRAHLLVRL